MKRTIFQIIIVLIVSNIYAQPTWNWQHPFPTGNEVTNVKFINVLTGYAIGPFCDIVRTTNGGASWSLVHTNRTERLECLDVIGTNVIIVAGREGIILRSSNSGATWEVIPSGVVQQLLTIEFFDASTGIIAGENNTILRTTNGGLNWQTVVSPVNAVFTSQSFPTSAIGYICGSGGKIIKTTNAGANWVEQFSTTTTSLFGIHFTDPFKGFVAGGINGQILKTTNGGSNYFYEPLGTFQQQVDIEFVNAQTGFLTTSGSNSGVIMKTTDSGSSWTTASNFSGFNVRFLNVIDESNIIGAGEVSFLDGRLYKTSNSGFNWSEFSHRSGTRVDFRSVDFVDNNTGIAVGDSGRILRTTNKGVTWNQVVSGTANSLRSLQFINALTGFISGSNATLLKTIDGGVSWSPIGGPTGSTLHSLYFSDANTGTVTGNGIWKTSNGGANWVLQLSNLDTIKSIIYLTPSIGLAGGLTGAYRTSNAGQNWIDISGGNEVLTISFADENTGIWAGNSGGSTNSLRRTTNGGLNFSSTVLTTNKLVYGSCFIAPNTFICVGEKGLVIKSTDRGVTWQAPQFVATEYNFWDADFINDSSGYIAGERGTILSTIPGGTVGITQVAGVIPDSYSLMQNYPNPFNPATIINYRLPKTNLVNLTVYDIAGKVVEELVNERQIAGEYTVTFDGSQMPSGIYFYRLDAGDFNQTRKMVLIK